MKWSWRTDSNRRPADYKPDLFYKFLFKSIRCDMQYSENLPQSHLKWPHVLTLWLAR